MLSDQESDTRTIAICYSFCCRFRATCYAVLMILSVAGARFAVKNLYFARRGDHAKPVAIYGAGEAGRQLLNALNQSREYCLVAFIDNDLNLERTDISGLRVEQLSRATALFDINNVRAVLMALPSASRALQEYN